MTNIQELKCSFDSNASSDSEDEANFADVPDDTLLGGLRVGMNTIRSHTRETLANCESEESCVDMTDRIESSTLKLMRAEKSLLETSRICVGIIDDVSSDLTDIEEREPGGNGDGYKNINNNNPSWLTIPSLPSLEVIISTRERMSQMLDQRLKTFNDNVTDEELKAQPIYTALQKEIHFGRKDFEQNQKLELVMSQQPKEESDDEESVFDVAAKILARKGDQSDFDFGAESIDEYLVSSLN